MTALAVAKYEAVGNDFLVYFDEPVAPLEELARELCDRRHGIGADGLIHLRPIDNKSTVAMTLVNADGSAAETSGNGLRCAGLAALHRGLVQSKHLDITTAAGVSSVELVSWTGEGSAELSADMGDLSIERLEDSPVPETVAFNVNVGNPHLVLLGTSFAGFDLARDGHQLSVAVPGGRNVELVSFGPESGALTLAVYERGAGITEACGSGSCAAAAAAQSIGKAGSSVLVHNPGGDLRVELSTKKSVPHAVLVGPARRVAQINVELDDVLSYELQRKAQSSR